MRDIQVGTEHPRLVLPKGWSLHEAELRVKLLGFHPLGWEAPREPFLNEQVSSRVRICYGVNFESKTSHMPRDGRTLAQIAIVFSRFGRNYTYSLQIHGQLTKAQHSLLRFGSIDKIES